MQLQPYVAAIAEDLDRATALADEQTREVAARVAASLEPAVRLALTHAITDAAAAITADLEDTLVTVRMDGRDPVLDVQQVAPSSPGATPSGGADRDDDGGTARVTVRLPDTLKRQAERSAAEADQSLNTWIVHAIRRATDPSVQGAAAELSAAIRASASPTPRRVTGWA